MKERRRSKRNSSKSVSIKGNKVSKIIFYKNIMLPLATFVFGILFLVGVVVDAFIKMQKLDAKVEEIKQKVASIKKKDQNILKSINMLKIRLSKENKKVIDITKIPPIIQKLALILKLKKIINDLQIVDIKNDNIYENVARVTLRVDYDRSFLDMNVLKKILALVFGEILYIKDINASGDTLTLEVYKKV